MVAVDMCLCAHICCVCVFFICVSLSPSTLLLIEPNECEKAYINSFSILLKSRHLNDYGIKILVARNKRKKGAWVVAAAKSSADIWKKERIATREGIKDWQKEKQRQNKCEKRQT